MDCKEPWRVGQAQASPGGCCMEPGLTGLTLDGKTDGMCQRGVAQEWKQLDRALAHTLTTCPMNLPRAFLDL
jgi:hypothetical protein